VRGPFAAINADDFYGRDSFVSLARFMDDTASEPALHGMVGFVLRNTLSEHGAVARGVCEVGLNSQVHSITEMTGIRRDGDGIRGPHGPLTGDEAVSMNMWGFKPSLFPQLERLLEEFLADSGRDTKAEFYIPLVASRPLALCHAQFPLPGMGLD